MNIQNNTPTTPLRQRMIEDMAARNLGRYSQRSHLRGCERFAVFLEHSPETATWLNAGEPRCLAQHDCLGIG